MLLQLVSPVGHVRAVVDVTSKGFSCGVSLHVSPQLTCLDKTLPAGLALETLVSVMSSNVSLQQGPLGCPVLAAVEGAPVDPPLVHPPVGRQVGAVLAGVRTELALELLLVGVDCLVLLQSGLLSEGLATGLTVELLLTVVLLVFPEVVTGLGPEVTVLVLAAEGQCLRVTGLVSQDLLHPGVLIGAPRTLVIGG